jgi:hypothetical protein
MHSSSDFFFEKIFGKTCAIQFLDLSLHYQTTTKRIKTTRFADHR